MYVLICMCFYTIFFFIKKTLRGKVEDDVIIFTQTCSDLKEERKRGL